VRRRIVRYGRLRSQVGELWPPQQPDGGPVPVVVLIHGGYWKAQYTKQLMHRLAGALSAGAWAAWNIEYRRTGTLGGGGGWPGTLDDVAAAIDALARMPGVDPERIATCGHSAGGHLALWAAARARLPDGAPGAGPAVGLRGAVALAGVVDLAEGARLGLGNGAVERLLGGSPQDHPDRYAAASPAALVPLSVPQVLIHGLADTVVPPAMSEHYARRAREAGDDAVYVPVEDVTHGQIISPKSASWPLLLGHLGHLLGGARATGVA
jgi:acetyl esterase/lipase